MGYAESFRRVTHAFEAGHEVQPAVLGDMHSLFRQPDEDVTAIGQKIERTEQIELNRTTVNVVGRVIDFDQSVVDDELVAERLDGMVQLKLWPTSAYMLTSFEWQGDFGMHRGHSITAFSTLELIKKDMAISLLSDDSHKAIVEHGLELPTMTQTVIANIPNAIGLGEDDILNHVDIMQRLGRMFTPLGHLARSGTLGPGTNKVTQSQEQFDAQVAWLLGE